MSHGLENVFKRLREDAINHAVDRFLAWRLPQEFAPDGGVSFKPPIGSESWPTGTNLLTAAQAREMLCHVLNADEYEKREATAAVFIELLRQLDDATRYGRGRDAELSMVRQEAQELRSLAAQLCKDLNEARTQMLVDQAMASPYVIGKPTSMCGATKT